MAKNTTAIKRGWSYTKSGSGGYLSAFVDGIEGVRLTKSTDGVDFRLFGDTPASYYINYDASGPTLTINSNMSITGDISLTGDLTVDTEDINLGDADDLEFGDSQDTVMRWSTGDANNHAFVIGLGDSNQGLHITDKAAVATDWNISATTHPTVYIHSNTTPATDYLLLGNHDGTTAHVDVVGGTTLSLDIAGSAEVTLTASALSPATSNGNALGTTSLMWADLFLASGGVINFNAGDVTLTHSSNVLTLGGGVFTASDTTETSSGATGAINTLGGLGVTKKVYVGTDIIMAGGDIDLSNGATGTYDIILKDAVADALSIRRSTTDMMVFNSSTVTIETTGKLQFGGATDWGTGATGTLIDGSGFDWVSQTVAHIDANLNGTAAAAAYHAITVGANQTSSNSVFGTWTELYIKNSIDLSGSDNYAATWGQIEAGTNVTLSDTGCFTTGGYFNVIAGATLTVASGHAVNGVRAQLEVAAISNSGTVAAFQALKKAGTVDWPYGLHLANTTQAVYANCSALANDSRIAQFYGTAATPNQSDGYGAFEIDFTVTGTATGQVNASSTWINLGTDATIPGYMSVHTDGIYDGTATLTNAYVTMQKYTCLLASNPAHLSIWELNYQSDANNVIDSMFNVNDAARALGYAEGTSGANLIGSIPFFSIAGGGPRYIYIYDAPPS